MDKYGNVLATELTIMSGMYIDMHGIIWGTPLQTIRECTVKFWSVLLWSEWLGGLCYPACILSHLWCRTIGYKNHKCFAKDSASE